MNRYKEILKQNIPRLLNLYNLDQSSSSHGFGDRLYWGWKISDFNNGTFQGGIHSLSIAMKLDLIRNKKFILQLIDSVISAVPFIRSKDGSLEEAYPGEKSFCVTALVAFDLLYSIIHLKKYIRQETIKEYINIIRPLIEFIINNDETHAIISNHLATAAAACIIWEKLTGEKINRGHDLLKQIFHNQSIEGWYREYEGADPGYQTLCTHYLFLIFENTRDEGLLKSLEKSASFLKYFLHPDGTIGGLYGSRNTEVFYPGGIIGLSDIIDDFALISNILQQENTFSHQILPQSVDGGNFIPLLNSYAVAALYYEKNKKSVTNNKKNRPHNELFSKKFKEAGIYIHSTKRYYSILNYKKGGTLKVFNKETALIDTEDGGLFGWLMNHKRFSTQQYDQTITFEHNTINSKFYLIHDRYLSPITNIIIRLFSLTIFRSSMLGKIFKKRIVKMLMTGKNEIDGGLVRVFKYQDDKIIINESVTKPKGCIKICHPGKSRAIHMASSGYYSIQDEYKPEKSNIVEMIIKDDTQI